MGQEPLEESNRLKSSPLLPLHNVSSLSTGSLYEGLTSLLHIGSKQTVSCGGQLKRSDSATRGTMNGNREASRRVPHTSTNCRWRLAPVLEWSTFTSGGPLCSQHAQ